MKQQFKLLFEEKFNELVLGENKTIQNVIREKENVKVMLREMRQSEKVEQECIGVWPKDDMELSVSE